MTILDKKDIYNLGHILLLTIEEYKAYCNPDKFDYNKFKAFNIFEELYRYGKDNYFYSSTTEFKHNFDFKKISFFDPNSIQSVNCNPFYIPHFDFKCNIWAHPLIILNHLKVIERLKNEVLECTNFDLDISHNNTLDLTPWENAIVYNFDSSIDFLIDKTPSNRDNIDIKKILESHYFHRKRQLRITAKKKKHRFKIYKLKTLISGIEHALNQMPIYKQQGKESQKSNPNRNKEVKQHIKLEILKTIFRSIGIADIDGRIKSRNKVPYFVAIELLYDGKKMSGPEYSKLIKKHFQVHIEPRTITNYLGASQGKKKANYRPPPANLDPFRKEIGQKYRAIIDQEENRNKAGTKQEQD